MAGAHAPLPSGMRVLERGWLSSNSLLVIGREQAGLVDSGYWTHAGQTVALVQGELQGRALTTLVNTHLHSDHCGGNAALQSEFPSLRTLIPPGQAPHVRNWDPVALTYVPTGQHCPAFQFDDLLAPGSQVVLGDASWEVHAAPGHDPHSVILFQPAERILVSADALWESGFGVVFPELEGEEHGFESVAATLAVIERLQPRLVIPGHGPVFDDVERALGHARTRLAAYVAEPRRHAAHGAKVLLKFKLLEVQEQPLRDFLTWTESTEYLRIVHARWFSARPMREWVASLLEDLARAGAVENVNGSIRNR